LAAQRALTQSFTAKVAKNAKENNSLTAKEIIIRSAEKSEGRKGTAPRVAIPALSWEGYSLWSEAVHA